MLASSFLTVNGVATVFQISESGVSEMGAMSSLVVVQPILEKTAGALGRAGHPGMGLP